MIESDGLPFVLRSEALLRVSKVDSDMLESTSSVSGSTAHPSRRSF